MFHVGPYSIPLTWPFLVGGFVSYVFVMWLEGRKDGFDGEKLFDLSFLSFFAGSGFAFVVNRYLDHLSIYRPSSVLLSIDRAGVLSALFLLSSCAVLLMLSKIWKWSVFRILDIFSVGATFFVSFLSLGLVISKTMPFLLPYTAALIIAYLFVFRLRGYRFKSGLVFSFFLFLNAAYLLILYRKPGYLIFAACLITIGLVNLFFRKRKEMPKLEAKNNFINSMKARLLKKDKQLRGEQKKLISEDPYLSEGRTSDNSEIVDEAILEDSRKELTDLSLDFVKKMRLQVRKALACISVGRYGICEICRKKIDPARLKAYPEATTCIECSQKKEYL